MDYLDIDTKKFKKILVNFIRKFFVGNGRPRPFSRQRRDQDESVTIHFRHGRGVRDEQGKIYQVKKLTTISLRLPLKSTKF
jgi:hypothetical protein